MAAVKDTTPPSLNAIYLFACFSQLKSLTKFYNTTHQDSYHDKCTDIVRTGAC